MNKEFLNVLQTDKKILKLNNKAIKQYQNFAFENFTKNNTFIFLLQIILKFINLIFKNFKK